MVDPYQAFIDNGNNASSECESTQLSSSLMQNMNETETIKYNQQQQQQQQHPNSVNEFHNNKIDVQNCDAENKFNSVNSERMCGPSTTEHGTDHHESINTTSSASNVNDLIIVASTTDDTSVVTAAINTIRVVNRDNNSTDHCVHSENLNSIQNGVIDDKTANLINIETNENHLMDNKRKQHLQSTNETVKRFSENNKFVTDSVESDSIGLDEVSNEHFTTKLNSNDESVNDNEMESRKVEPLRININREPIKTKIKLGQQPQASSLSPSTVKYSTSTQNAATALATAATVTNISTTNSLDSDIIDEESSTVDEPTQVFPKITIKPIKPPASNDDHHSLHHHHHNTHHSHHGNHHNSQSTSQSTQEAIPKLKIKVDSTSSNSSSSSSISQASTLNTSDEDGDGNMQLSPSEPCIVPKLTIRSSTTNSSSGSNSNNAIGSEMESVPKLTIKKTDTNHQANTTIGVSLVSNEGYKVTLKPLAEPPLPKLTIKTNAANDTAEVVKVNNASTSSSATVPKITIKALKQSLADETSDFVDATDNSNSSTHAVTSTRLPNDENSSSSTSSSSSAFGKNDDQLKLIIKATSTGSCVVNANTSSVARSSPSTTAHRGANTLKLNNKSITSTTVSSSSESTARNSPIPKSLTRTDENIVIPKVTIKPIVKPNDGTDVAEQPRVTPKIILKPIPKPMEKPLEIITAPSSPFSRTSDSNESQQSPRIILKINKNATSQTTEAILLTKPSTSLASPSLETTKPDEVPSINARGRSKLAQHLNDDEDDDDVDDDDDDVQTLSSDSEPEMALNRKISSSMAAVTSSETTSSLSHSDLRSILSRPQMKINPPQSPNFMQNTPPFTSSIITSSTSQTNTVSSTGNSIPKNSADVIDLCHDSNDELIPGALIHEEEVTQVSTSLTSSVATNSSSSAPTTTSTSSASSESSSTTSSKYKWSSFFYNNEENRSNEVHPLLQHHIERANVLEAMMNASNNRDSSTSNGESGEKPTLKRKHELLDECEGSSSDCIVIEDTASEPFPFNSNSNANNGNDQNGQKKESVDRDSGVDVSSSLKSSTGEESEVTPAKRPRGRPKKIKSAADVAAQKKPASNRKKEDLLKRKFAGIMMSDHNSRVTNKQITLPQLLNNNVAASDVTATSNASAAVQQTTILTASGTMTITSTTAPTAPQPPAFVEPAENKISIVPIPIASPKLAPTQTPIVATSIASTALAINPAENEETPNSSPTIEAKTIEDNVVAVPMEGITTTPIASKERKRRIVVDDDDESPTFNPLSRSSKKMKGRGRRGRGALMRPNQRKMLLQSPEKTMDSTSPLTSATTTTIMTTSAAIVALSMTSTTTVNDADSNLFTSPEGIERRKLVKDTIVSSALQVFEEDTRMSADSMITSQRSSEFLQNDESQSSLQSSTSATVEGSVKRIRSKIEVADPEGRTEFTVDLIAEYDWPPPKGCCPSRNRDTFMIQEQIAEYLGVKSFKRKYPDLPRRMVDMEERNYLMEKGLVSEKMCDLGLTAVLASDVLDIMHTDFYEKYEEYRRYLREKHLRDLAARQKSQQMQVVGKSMSARENAMRSALSWNTSFNKSRKEDRRECLDLQNFVVQVPAKVTNSKNRPNTKPSPYPIALVPDQFQEYYRHYSAAELLCYPINTVLADPHKLERKLHEYYDQMNVVEIDTDSDSDDSECDTCSNGSSSDSDSSDSSSGDSSSSDDEEVNDPNVKEEKKTDDEDSKPLAKVKKEIVAKKDRTKCRVCQGVERCNPNNIPELFVRCSVCRGGMHPSCASMSSRKAKRVNEYAWQCKDCKHCIKCRRTEDDDKFAFCEQCDRGYHIYCIGLRKVPTDPWHCAVCTVCTLCGARRPEGHNNPNLTPQQKQKLLAVAKWTHEYAVNPVTNAREHSSMLCTSCVAIKNSTSKNIYFA